MKFHNNNVFLKNDLLYTKLQDGSTNHMVLHQECEQDTKNPMPLVKVCEQLSFSFEQRMLHDGYTESETDNA